MGPVRNDLKAVLECNCHLSFCWVQTVNPFSKYRSVNGLYFFLHSSSFRILWLISFSKCKTKFLFLFPGPRPFFAKAALRWTSHTCRGSFKVSTSHFYHTEGYASTESVSEDLLASYFRKVALISRKRIRHNLALDPLSLKRKERPNPWVPITT